MRVAHTERLTRRAAAAASAAAAARGAGPAAPGARTRRGGSAFGDRARHPSTSSRRAAAARNSSERERLARGMASPAEYRGRVGAAVGPLEELAAGYELVKKSEKYEVWSKEGFDPDFVVRAAEEKGRDVRTRARRCCRRGRGSSATGAASSRSITPGCAGRWKLWSLRRTTTKVGGGSARVGRAAARARSAAAVSRTPSRRPGWTGTRSAGASTPSCAARSSTGRRRSSRARWSASSRTCSNG